MFQKSIITTLGLLILGCQISHDAIGEAAFNGQIARVKHFLRAGGDIDQTDSLGMSLLQNAIFGGSTEVADFLINEGADVNFVSRSSYTPLVLACEAGNVEITTLLLERGADPNLIPESLLDPRAGGQSALHAASMKDKPNLLALLIQYGGKVDLPHGGEGLFRGFSPLMCTKPDFRESIEVLLSHGADPNFPVESAYGLTSPYYRAAEKGDLDLLQRYASVVPPQDPVLIQTGLLKYHVETGQIEKARANVEAGADIKRKSLLGNSLMHSAAIKDQSRSIRFLFTLGCNLDELDGGGKTPLMISSRYGKQEAVAVLLELGANRNLTSKLGETAREMAADAGYKEITELLSSEE